VQGKVFTDSLLDVVAQRIMNMKAYNLVVRNKNNKELFQKFDRYSKEGNVDSVRLYKAAIDKLTNAELKNIPMYKFGAEQRKAYTTVGGTPHLDGSYTVFGEVIEGMNVVDIIAAAPCDQNNRPLEDIRMKISVIK
jgi:cyclophilin family peptidyl-prolyl cis-trans isomerase